MLGPLFVPELLRLTRSPWTLLLRVAYGLVTLLALATSFGSRTSESPPVQTDELANLYLLVFAAAILTPVAAAGVGLPARDRAALDALRSAAGDADLVRGLVAARAVAFGAAAALTPLPVLVVLAHQGPGAVVLSVTAFQFALVLAHAATSVRAGLGIDAGWKDVGGTSAVGCGLALQMWVFVTLLASRVPVEGAVWVGTGLLGAAGAAACVVYTALTVRGLRRHDPDPTPTVGAEGPERPRPSLPPVTDDAILWRERTLRPVSLDAWFGEAVPLFGSACLVVAALEHFGGPVWAMTAWLLSGLLALVVGLRAADRVAFDRERRTLEVLLTTPAGRPGVFAAKGRVALGPAGWLVPPCGLIVVLGPLLTYGPVEWPPLSVVVLVPLALSAWAVLAAAAGLWLSVAMPTRRAAVLAFGIGLVSVTVAGVALSAWLPPPGWPGQHPVVAAAELAAVGGAAWLLWRDAARRFDRDPLGLG